MSDTVNVNQNVYSKSNRTQQQKYMCITNWGSFVLLQIRANVVTNWGSCYKSGQPLIHNTAAITNWGKIYYKLGQVLQIRAIITNCGITCKMYVQNVCFI